MARLNPGVETPVIVNFLPSRAGLTTVGYRLLDKFQQIVQGRTTTGVTEVWAGLGVYSVLLTFPDAFEGYIVWDTGQSPVGVGTAKLRTVVEDLVVAPAVDFDGVTGAVEALYEENVMKIPNAANPTALRIVRKRSTDSNWNTPVSDITIPIIRTRGLERFGGPPAGP